MEKGTVEGVPEQAEQDNDFEPTADMLVHEMDDEHTLDEEENLSADGSDEDEVDNLLKEGDMPLEELLALYGRPNDEQHSISNDHESSNCDSQGGTYLTDEQLTDGDNAFESEDDNEEDDDDYTPEQEEYWKKNIRVGEDYQVELPPPCTPSQAASDPHDAELLWDPGSMPAEQVESYLQQVAAALQQPDVADASLVYDEAQALYLLVQSQFNAEKALKSAKTKDVNCHVSDTENSAGTWTEDECQNFEAGLRLHGKNFFLIQQNRLKSRTVGDLVKFYYFWKKTERREAFADLGKLEKRKCVLNPGTTDYVDRYGDQALFSEAHLLSAQDSCVCPPDELVAGAEDPLDIQPRSSHSSIADKDQQTETFSSCITTAPATTTTSTTSIV